METGYGWWPADIQACRFFRFTLTTAVRRLGVDLVVVVESERAKDGNDSTLQGSVATSVSSS
jgi:hypothetical protein